VPNVLDVPVKPSPAVTFTRRNVTPAEPCANTPTLEDIADVPAVAEMVTSSMTSAALASATSTPKPTSAGAMVTRFVAA
jgi:hypothetical protein